MVGIVPTPFGNIHLKWEKSNKAIISLPNEVNAEWRYNGIIKKRKGGKKHEINVNLK